jgi:hypothetical protein
MLKTYKPWPDKAEILMRVPINRLDRLRSGSAKRTDGTMLHQAPDYHPADVIHPINMRIECNRQADCIRQRQNTSTGPPCLFLPIADLPILVGGKRYCPPTCYKTDSTTVDKLNQPVGQLGEQHDKEQA